MGAVMVSNKGQIVIPKELREKYGIEPKNKVEVTEIDARICIIPLLKDPIKEAKGMLKMKRKATEVLFEERRKDRKLEEKRVKKWLKK